ncbi:GNAT family N-acetyltransferase [Bacillus pinisoli]|uniref:GNAT family N-acetyltransferase n=1 Tax=Bacillus pinisoli TaxID=2901866 RepID=UPI001FF62753
MELRIVTKDQLEVLGNLFEYYVYEFSPILQIDVSKNGKYGFTKIHDYFTYDRYHPYFILSEEKLIGFCIVEKVSDQEFDYRIDQFFILKKYGNRGLGSKAATKIFDLFKGKWQITQTETNYRAQAFWRKLIKEYSNNQFSEFYDSNRRSIQTFSNDKPQKML